LAHLDRLEELLTELHRIRQLGGTGLSPGTISRWIRLAGNEPLLAALEDGRIDLFRATHLVGVRDPALLMELIGLAPRYPPEDFYALVQQRTVSVSDSAHSLVNADRRLAVIAGRLATVQCPTPQAEESLQRIIENASTLLHQVRSAGRAGPRTA
jgi:hypothetical protein